jgi:hypothetical protein
MINYHDRRPAAGSITEIVPETRNLTPVVRRGGPVQDQFARSSAPTWPLTAHVPERCADGRPSDGLDPHGWSSSRGLGLLAGYRSADVVSGWRDRRRMSSAVIRDTTGR